ncbi:MAG: redoxin domain-containing protein [Candidatus Marsarchaeota archaeon]|jgi:Peroxiredoxin|nr:redoxin domain-containing protein [Candidatus Marsarchaeota archaeon]
MVAIDQEVPGFEVESFQNGNVNKIKLTDYRGKWLVLVFYPADFSFVCPTELEELANYYEEFKKAGAEVMSVSTDTIYVHKAWHDVSPTISKITFPMLADPAGKLSKAFSTYVEDTGLSLRGSFIIDPDGKIKSYEITDNSIGRNMKELLRRLTAAVYVREHPGEVCPVNWDKDKKSLTPSMDLVGKL